MNESTRKDILARLQSLRHIFATEAVGSPVDFFDELTEHHEFGLALHEICEYLLERDSSNMTASDVDQIEILHNTMEIDNQCVAELKRRLARGTPDPSRRKAND